MASRLVLWDVDFTLVDTAGVGRRLYELAFAELYGRDLPPAATQTGMAGRTDHAIVLDVLTRAGIAEPRGQVRRFEAVLARCAPSVAETVAATGRALPGAEAALAAVAALGASQLIRQSLLTGNVREVAEVKLRSLGLARHIDFDVAAYGDEHEVRSELVHLARKRAAVAYGADFDGEATVLVGDTPLDVAAALTTGARAVGVATGQFTLAQLAQADAHAVLPDLTATTDVLAAILGTDIAQVTSRDRRSAAQAGACPG